MSLSLTTPDWMMVTRLIYRINCLEDAAAFRQDILGLLQSVVPYYRGLLYLSAGQTSMDGINLTESELSNITDMNLNDTLFMKSLFLGSANICRGPSVLELNNSGFGESLFPADAQHALTVLLQYRESQLGYIILLRRNTDEEFSRRDFCVLEELHPHISLLFHRLSSIHTRNTPEHTLLLWESSLTSWELSKKEMEVLYHFYSGLTDAQLCDKLFISRSTLKKHVNHIYQKTGVCSRLELSKWLDDRIPSLYKNK